MQIRREDHIIKIDPSTVVPNGIITGRPGFARRCDTTVVNVLVIEYCNLFVNEIQSLLGEVFGLGRQLTPSTTYYLYTQPGEAVTKLMIDD
jgi:hypothetical protein